MPPPIDWLLEHYLLTFALFTVVLELIAIGCALEAILKSRTSQGAMAWSISLVTMPFIMVPLYGVFGRRKFRGYKKARRSGTSEIEQVAFQLKRAMERFEGKPEVLGRLAPLEKITRLNHSLGNRLRLLCNGEQAFDTMFQRIAAAEHYILLEFYIVRDDDVGKRLQQLLLERAAAGIEVYFIYDEIGSLHLSKRFIKQLRRGGVHITDFNSTKGRRNRFQLNFRNHRKICCVDGQWASVGGINIGDEYLGGHPVLHPWRDTNIAVEGPAVAGIQLTFLEDWYWATESIPPLAWSPQRAPGLEADTAGAATLVFPTGPADSLDSCELFYLHAIHSARDRLWIVSPYFVPDNAVLYALQLAALRKVDVRILLPEKADNRLVQLSSFAYIRDTLPYGIKVYRYSRGFLHQKVLLIDEDISAVGTSNLDNRSFRLNFEINIVTRDKATTAAVAEMLERDFAASTPVDYASVSALPLSRRLLIRFANLLAPIQ